MVEAIDGPFHRVAMLVSIDFAEEATPGTSAASKTAPDHPQRSETILYSL
jgi:hypothetical protein